MDATIISVGRSSIKVKVEAFSEGAKTSNRLVCSAIITMVSVIEEAEGKFVKYDHNKSID